jgi:nitroimidazol reductase NimA-like FMN-containing flavoprotein (pyridoxamine 5'-phosphate oxidase superfamily)
MTTQGSRKPHTFQEIDESECLDLLTSSAVGRVAFNGEDGILVFPVNHVLHDGDIYFRTTPYGSLADRLRHDHRVSFQIDDVDDFFQAGWSVLVVGTAELVDPHEALVSLESTEHPDPWAAGSRSLTVRIKPHRITGRRVLPG